MFKAVIEGFLNKYQKGKKPAMFKKHKPVLTMLLDVVGDKPISDLRQSDINEFFELLGNLPPRWSDECRIRGVSVRELAELDHTVTLGPKTLDDTYIASVRSFLKAAKKDWQDEGLGPYQSLSDMAMGSKLPAGTERSNSSRTGSIASSTQNELQAGARHGRPEHNSAA